VQNSRVFVLTHSKILSKNVSKFHYSSDKCQVTDTKENIRSGLHFSIVRTNNGFALIDFVLRIGSGRYARVNVAFDIYPTKQGNRIVSALYNYRKPFLAKLHRNDRGQTAVEYVMLIVLVAVSIFITSPNVTDSVMGVFSGTSKMLEDGMSSQGNPAGVPDKPSTENRQ